MHDDLKRAIDDLFPSIRKRLEDLIHIPSVSADGYEPSEVRRSADATAALLRQTGLHDVRLLEIEGAHPAVYGELPGPKGSPTVLLYAHHDVQPPGTGRRVDKSRIRAGREGRTPLREGLLRRQVRDRGPPRSDRSPPREAAGGGEGVRRGRRRDRLASSGRLHRGVPRVAGLGRHRHRRQRQPRDRQALVDDVAAGAGRLHRGGAHARARRAFWPGRGRRGRCPHGPVPSPGQPAR